VLQHLATSLRANIPFILAENSKDLAKMAKDNPKYDRLLLNETRLLAIAQDLEKVATLPSPLQIVLQEKNLPNGLHLKKVSVPLGVVGVIYEARPNVTFDVFALCLKAGNVCVLKGGSDAEFSNKAIVNLIKQSLKAYDITPEALQLLPVEREATEALLNAVGYVDVLIPRGSQQLIDYVRQNAKIPVIETGAGIVHTYIDKSADIEKATQVIHNAKTRRVSVCNALDCVIIHQARLAALPQLLAPLAKHQVTIFADEKSFEVLQKNYPENYLEKVQKEHFGTEFLDYKLAIKTVQDVEEALQHIAQYSSKHSEAIMAEDTAVCQLFTQRVDAAVVYVNVSTAFTDGGQFGMGAEIGISTQKLHARGPMALPELTSYKWIVVGNGQIRA
ncbi:MAG: glutamate-5-semialdehyde dehydrogenase, partial [Thermoflexibacteraceae bacterium]